MPRLPSSAASLSSLFVLFVSLVVPSARAEDLATHLRRPIALAPSSDNKWLYVANRDSGTLSILDLASQQVAAEHKIAQRLSDLTTIPGSSHLLATDEAAHELLLLESIGPDIRVVHSLPISPYPVSICVSPDSKTATIASLWSRRLTFVLLPLPLGEAGTARSVVDEGVSTGMKIQHILDLPFAPRAQLLLPDRNCLLVADAFGGKLALIDPRTLTRRVSEGITLTRSVSEGLAPKITATREIPGHNIRGLGRSPGGEMLLVSHQMLNDLAHSIRNDIHWGLLMTNDLRWLKVDSVLTGGDHLYRGGHMHPLGDPGKGGADPGALAVAPDGTVVVTLSGVNQVAFGKEGDFSMQRLKVGRRPTAVTLSPLPLPLGAGRGQGASLPLPLGEAGTARCVVDEGLVAYIANTFDDSISILDLNRRAITATVSLGPSPELSLPQRGEILFYDASLSHDSWMSCHSCHTDGHANGQMNDNFSDRSFGAAKRVLSLLGVKDTLPLAWNGQVQTLEQQIQNSTKSTMQREDALPSEDVRALAAYVNTLEPPPPLDELRGTSDKAAINRGRRVFDRHGCANCHAPPTYTSPNVYDVGLRDTQGVKEFNPPSLRGLSHRGPYFHDSTAATLDDVFTTHRHPSDSPIAMDDLSDLLAFLLSL